MNHPLARAVAAMSVLTCALVAQDPPKNAPGDAGHGAPAPKHAAHDALRSLAGSWDCNVKMAAMPGVPGMEEPTELASVEHAELICDGLWLKSTLHGTFMGQPFEGVWLAGYDPHREQYVSLWVDNHEATVAKMYGTHDADARTWSWSGETARGKARSEVVWKDADTTVETCWITPEGGAETQTMVITRRRADAGPVAREASAARATDDLPAPLRELHRGLGTWDAVVRSQVDPAQPAVEEQCTNRVRAICDGRYTWSDFRGQRMGTPFEGHALVGFDADREQYVCYWIDSMSPTWVEMTGGYDPETKSIEMTGSSTGPDGTPVRVTESLTWKGADQRHSKLRFESALGTQEMEITYRRASDRRASDRRAKDK